MISPSLERPPSPFLYPLTRSLLNDSPIGLFRMAMWSPTGFVVRGVACGSVLAGEVQVGVLYDGAHFLNKKDKGWQ